MADWEAAPEVQTSWQDAPFASPAEIVPVPPPPQTEREDRLANVRLADTGNKLDLFVAGMKSGAAGLALGKPDVLPPNDMSITDQIITGAGQMLSDAPAMIVGGVGAGAVASETGPGALVAAGAGGAALPTVVRESLMDHYRYGDAVSFQDMVNRTLRITKETAISAVAGAAMGPLGKFGGDKVLKAGGGKAIAALVDTATQATSYAALSSAMHGQVPSADEVLTGGMLALMTHGMVHGGGKIAAVFKPGTREMTQGAAAAADNVAKVYAGLGIHPKTVAKLVEENPVIGQEVLSTSLDGNPEIVGLEAYRQYDPKVATGDEMARQIVSSPETPNARDRVLLDQYAKEPPTPEQAQANIESRIAPEEKAPSAFKQVADFVADVPRELWNKYAPLEAIAEGEGQSNAATMMRQTLASPTRAQYMLTHGGVSGKPESLFDARPDVPSYKEGLVAFKDAGATREDMRDFMLAKRTLEVNKRGIETSIDPESAKVFVEAHPEFEAANKILNQARQGKLDYARDAGLISAAQLQHLRDTGMDYAPLAVATEGKTVTKTVKGGGTLKRLKGQNEFLLNDPVPVDIENFHALVRAADRNRALKPLVDAIGKGGMEDIVKRVGEPVKLGDDAGELLEGRLRPQELPANQVVFMRDGVPELYEFADENIAALYKVSTPGEANVLTKVLRGITTSTRMFITHNPIFPVMNTLSDAFSSAILTKGGSVPLHDLLAGFAEATKHGDLWKEWARMGGSGAALRNFSRDYVKNDIEDLFAKTGTWDRVLNTVPKAVQKLGDWQEFLDTTNRLGRYKRTRGDNPESRLEAAIGSRKAYLDFQQKGASSVVNYFAAITPFMRPAMLGLEQFGNGFKTPERAAKTMAKIAAFVVMPSVVSWATNMYMMGPDWAKYYQSLDKWVRDLYWIVPVPTPNGITAIRLKKPPGVGLMGSYVERFLDHALAKSPTATREMMSNTVQAFLPNYVPAAAQPFIETAFNESLYTGHPLVSGALEGATGYMQYTENTSEVAKKITDLIGPSHANIADMSPIMLEQFVRSWTGKPGIAVLHALDAPLGATAVPEDLANNPFVAGFLVRNPGMNAAQISAFYDRATKYREAQRDVSLAKSRLNLTELQEAALNKKRMGAPAVAQYSDALHNMLLAVNRIRDNKKMTVDEKRQQTEKIYLDARSVADKGLQFMNKIEAD